MFIFIKDFLVVVHVKLLDELLVIIFACLKNTRFLVNSNSIVNALGFVKVYGGL